MPAWNTALSMKNSQAHVRCKLPYGNFSSILQVQILIHWNLFSNSSVQRCSCAQMCTNNGWSLSNHIFISSQTSSTHPSHYYHMQIKILCKYQESQTRYMTSKINTDWRTRIKPKFLLRRFDRGDCRGYVCVCWGGVTSCLGEGGIIASISAILLQDNFEVHVSLRLAHRVPQY